MTRGVPYPPEVRAKAVELYVSRLSIERVEKVLGGPTIRSIYEWIVAAGVNRTISEAQRHRPDTYRDDQKAAILALYTQLQGRWPLREIIERWMR